MALLSRLVVALVVLLLCAFILESHGELVRCPSLGPQHLGNETAISGWASTLAFVGGQWAFAGHVASAFAVRGAVLVYKFDPVDQLWRDHQQIRPSDESNFTDFGWSVQLNGDDLFVGAPRHNNATGAVYVFQHNSVSDQWEEVQQILPTDTELEGVEQFGITISSCSNVLAVSASNQLTEDKRLHVFRYSPSSSQWEFSQLLIDPIHNSSSNYAGALSCSSGSNGKFIFVGNSYYSPDEEEIYHVGTVHIYKEQTSDSTFQFHQQLIVPGVTSGFEFGRTISADPNGWVAILSREYVFLLEFDAITGNFTERQQITVDSIEFVRSISLKGSRLALGARSYNNFFNYGTGAIFVVDFNATSGVWEQQTDPIIGHDAKTGIGAEISVDGDQLISTCGLGGALLVFDNSYLAINTTIPHNGNVSGVDQEVWSLSKRMAVNWKPFTQSDSTRVIKEYDVVVFESGTNEVVYHATHPNLAAEVLVHEGTLPLFRMKHNTSYFTSVILANCARASTKPFLVQLSKPQPGEILFPGEAWSSNSSITVKWTEFSDSQANMTSYEVGIEDANTNELIVPFVNFTLELEGTIEIDPSLPYGQHYRVVVRGTNEDGQFSTVSKTIFLANIHITDIRNTTNSTSTLMTGHHASIHWFPQGLEEGTAQLYIVDASTNTSVKTITPEPIAVKETTFDWDPVSIDLLPGLYRIAITASLNNIIFEAFSDILDVEDSEEYISIHHPNETTIWTLGHSGLITWSANGTLGDVSLDLFRDKEFVLHLGVTEVEKSNFIWSIPSTLESASNYRIMASSVQIPSVVFSTRRFEIDEVKSLSIVEPALNSSEYLICGHNNTIKWATTGTLSNLNIRVTSGNGNWIDIATGVNVADLSFQWNVPEALIGESNHVEISCPKYGITAKSQAFEVDVEKTITISTPSEEVVVTDQKLDLSWNITGNMALFVIEVTNETGDGVLGVVKQNVSTTSVTLEAADLRSSSLESHSIRIQVRSEQYTGVAALSPVITLKDVPSSAHSNGITWAIVVMCAVLMCFSFW